MMRTALAAAALLAAARAGATDVYGVLAVADPPAGPGAELAETTHQLRAACRDRVGGVLAVPEMRARLLGQRSNATLPELERAYVGAEAAFQNEEIEIAASTLRGIVDDLEKLPESPEVYAQWTRAMIRLAYVERILTRHASAATTLERLAATDPRVVVDEVQYPPSFRAEFDEARRRVAARRKFKLTITSPGRVATAFVNGRKVGRTPVTVALTTGRYRVGGSAEGLRVPSTFAQLDPEDRQVELDFAAAEALRINAGPGLAVQAPARAGALVRAGSWLAATRVVAATEVVESDARFLTGALYDVQRGALLREGRVRMVAGSVPSTQLGALASFLLTGQPANGVEPVAAPPPAPARSPNVLAAPVAPAVPLAATAHADRSWMRPAAYAAGGVAVVLAGIATWQGVRAHAGYRDANGMVRPDGSLVPGLDAGAHDRAVASADGSRRNAYLAAVGAALFAATAGVLGYLSWDERGAPAVRF
jgi:hypothetical protein